MALLVPIAVSAQTFDQKDTAKVPSKLTITVNPGVTAPARLKYAGGNQTFEAQGDSLNVTYEATGLTIEMTGGEYTASSYTSPWRSRNKDTFKTLVLTFATNGDLVSIKPSKD